MDNYLLVDTRDPFDSNGGGHYGLAVTLAAEADDVVVYLVQNAVLATRRASAAARDLEGLASQARVVADDFSLRARAINPDEVVGGVNVASADDLVALLVDDGRKSFWL